MTGAETLGLQSFSYDLHQGALTAERLQEAHNKLLDGGFLFAGWHGTQREVCEKLINGEKIRPSAPEGGEIWNGFYVSNKVEHAFGYAGGQDFPPRQGGFLRTYVRDADVDHVIVASADINDITGSDDINGSIRTGRKRYVLSGPENTGHLQSDTDQQPHELVLSSALLDSIVFLPSLHTTTLRRNDLTLSSSTQERCFAGYDITQRGAGFHL